MSEPSLQDRYGPESICFGCGPANRQGLRIKSRLAPDNPEETVCDWTPEKHHEAFEGFLSGGIIGTLLDCHCIWTAAYHLMKKMGRTDPPYPGAGISAGEGWETCTPARVFFRSRGSALAWRN